MLELEDYEVSYEVEIPLISIMLQSKQTIKNTSSQLKDIINKNVEKSFSDDGSKLLTKDIRDEHNSMLNNLLSPFVKDGESVDYLKECINESSRKEELSEIKDETYSEIEQEERTAEEFKQKKQQELDLIKNQKELLDVYDEDNITLEYCSKMIEQCNAEIKELNSDADTNGTEIPEDIKGELKSGKERREKELKKQKYYYDKISSPFEKINSLKKELITLKKSIDEITEKINKLDEYGEEYRELNTSRNQLNYKVEKNKAEIKILYASTLNDLNELAKLKEKDLEYAEQRVDENKNNRQEADNTFKLFEDSIDEEKAIRGKELIDSSNWDESTIEQVKQLSEEIVATSSVLDYLPESAEDYDKVLETIEGEISKALEEACVPDNTIVFYLDEVVPDTLGTLFDFLDFDNLDFTNGLFDGMGDDIVDILKDFVDYGDPKDSPIDIIIKQALAAANEKERCGHRYGLWAALYEAMQLSGDLSKIVGFPDVTGFVYSTLICTVIALYFTFTLTTSIHIGLKFIGVSVSYLSEAITGLLVGIPTFKDGYTNTVPEIFTNMFNQCKGIMEGEARIYEGSLLLAIAIGIRRTAFFFYPFIDPICTKVSLNTSIGKWLLLVTSLIAYAVLVIGAFLTNITEREWFWEKIGLLEIIQDAKDYLGISNEKLPDLVGYFENGDDVLAFFMALGIKLSLILMIAKVASPLTFTIGTGIVLPIGP